LTAIEFEAMQLIETGNPDAEANRSRARLIMHDARYHQEKAGVMRPINAAFELMDKRTSGQVREAESIAIVFLALFIASIFVALFMLWRAHAVLRKTLGAPADEVHAHIGRIGRGDLSSPIPVAPGIEGSVLAGLRAMQIKLQASELRHSALFTASPDAMLISDAQGVIAQANQQVERLLGYSADELIGRPIDELVPEHLRGNHAERRAEFAASPAGRRMGRGLVVKARRKDGSEVDVEVSLSRIETGEGFLYVSALRDITERKLAEADLRIAATAFEAQEGIVVTDARGVILRINKAFTETTGYTAEDVVGKTPRLLKSGRHDADFYRSMWETVGLTGGWQGEIWDRRKSGELYPKWLTISAVRDQEGRVTHYVGTHFDITQLKKAEERVEELAFFDQLTHLPNRTLLLDRLTQAMTAGSRNRNFGAVLFIDLDHFKTLNDTRGHDKGDLLLEHVAQRLNASVREGDTVARLGGDEFVVVLGGLRDNALEAANQTEGVGEKILAALRQPYRLGNIDHIATASIGATLFDGHQTSIDELLKQADLAMYKAKDSGRNVLRFFDREMQTVVMERVALEADLRQALVANQFLLHYQAQAVDNQRVSGAEVLVRWKHPQRGMVSPADFIPLAEETGLILPLGHWVLQTACRTLAHWATRPEMAHLTVAVNVSAHQFRQTDFVNEVLSVLDDTSADPGLLKLELTESMLVSDVDDIVEKMFALQSKGVRFSLDDFGTGYSSLSYLKRLPLDQLKIDQSFVRDVLNDSNDAAIAKTVIALAKALGLGVIAEGVETDQQREFMADSGCHAYQGYFFSRPLPVDDFEKFALENFSKECVSP
jgi:diguanylate cyclase (GGDEF)-like protein/PAS domain S-box-containing protein